MDWALEKNLDIEDDTEPEAAPAPAEEEAAAPAEEAPAAAEEAPAAEEKAAEAEAEADPQYFQLGNRLGKFAGLVIGELSKVLTSIYLHLN